jgi:hypothetical protein
MSYRIVEAGTILFLGWILVWLTFPFEQDYDESLRTYAHEPLFRILLGLMLVAASAYSVPVALLLFVITFFWITDVQLISNIKTK